MPWGTAVGIFLPGLTSGSLGPCPAPGLARPASAGAAWSFSLAEVLSSRPSHEPFSHPGALCGVLLHRAACPDLSPSPLPRLR